MQETDGACAWRHAYCKQRPWGAQVVLAQVAQSARSTGLEQRLAALEHAHVPGSAQGSPGSRRMTHGAAEPGCEAKRAEDLSSILGRLVLPSLTHCTAHCFIFILQALSWIC